MEVTQDILNIIQQLNDEKRRWYEISVIIIEMYCLLIQWEEKNISDEEYALNMQSGYEDIKSILS